MLRAHLLAERGNARDVLDVVEDAGAEGGLRERVDRREDGGVGAHGDLLQSGRVLGAGGLAEVAALAVSGRLARAAEAREAEVRSGRAGDRQKNLGEGRPGERVFGGDAGESRGGKWAHPFWLFGELKQSGAGERAGSAVSAAACASLTPWARRAREGVMGDSALAKSKKGEDKSAACESGEGRVSRRRGQRSRVNSDTPGCGRVGRVEARERARGAASPGRVRCRRKPSGREREMCMTRARTVSFAPFAPLPEGRSGVNMPGGSWLLSMSDCECALRSRSGEVGPLRPRSGPSLARAKSCAARLRKKRELFSPRRGGSRRGARTCDGRGRGVSGRLGSDRVGAG